MTLDPHASTRRRPRIGTRPGPLAGLGLCVLLAALGNSLAPVALPALSRAFAAPFAGVQGVLVAYLAATTVGVVVAGRLGDALGRRRVLLAGLALFALASIAAAAAPSLALLVVARAGQGLGAAAITALALAAVGDVVPLARTGAAMGGLGTLSAIGTALGPTLGGALLAGAGWRAVFFAAVPLAAVALGLVWRHLPVGDAADAGAKTPGAEGRAETSGAGAREGLPASATMHALARDIAPGLAASLLASAVVMATLVVGPFYLARAFGLGPAHVGLVLTAGPLVSALVGFPAGRLVDRWGSARTTRAGLAAMAAGCALVALSPLVAGVAGYVGPLVVLTAAYALFQAANNTAVVSTAGAGRRGAVSGLLGLARNLGLIIGASAMGAVFAAAAGARELASATPAQVSAGLHATFGVAAALVLVALGISVLAIARGRGRGAARVGVRLS